MGKRDMTPTRWNIICTLVPLMISGCGGTGSGLMGISGGGGGGGGNGAPPVLSFFVGPSTANVGQTMNPPVEVLATDSVGSTDSSFTGTIVVALASNSTGASLSGTTAVRPVNGIASFTNLAIDKAGTYTLIASTSGATTITSGAFTITPTTGP